MSSVFIAYPIRLHVLKAFRHLGRRGSVGTRGVYKDIHEHEHTEAQHCQMSKGKGEGYKNQRGISLVELLIASMLSLFLLNVILATYLNDKKTYRYGQNLSHMQENARVAVEWLTRDARMIGFIGCRRLTELQPGNTNLTAPTSLMGWRDKSMVPSSFSLPKNCQANSDILLMQMASARSMAIHAARAAIVDFVTKPEFKINTALLIADCEKAEVFYFGHPHLRQTYQSDASVYALHKIIYYVARTNRKNQAAHVIHALYRRDLNAPPTKSSELVEGIDAIQIEYGIPTSSYRNTLGTADHALRYVLAGDVSDWSQVKSLKIHLLLSSLEDIANEPLPYVFQGKTYVPKDRRLRQAWSAVVALREREIWQ